MTDHQPIDEDWGYIEDGKWRPLSKKVMLDAGYTTPPFDIEIRTGVIRRVVVRPAT